MRVPIFSPIHREGWIFISIFFILTLIMAFLSFHLLWPGLILTGWCTYFFRDPIRMVPTRPGLIVSPADGFIQSIVKVIPPPELGLSENNWTRISIFLSVFDVHINRVPCEGQIKHSVYHAGKFFNASLDKASEHNERQSLVLQHFNGTEIAFVQIAGLIARRILCQVHQGDYVKTGQRYGMIRFGSRVDLYLPENVPCYVIEGQRVIGGETIFADFTSQESSRVGISQ